MKLALIGELLVLGVFVMNLADQDGESPMAVCEQVLQADNLCCSLLEPPLLKNREKILQDIRKYLGSLDLLIQCIQRDKSKVEETPVCKELIDDLPRGSKYMTVTFDYYKLREGFNWTDTNMADYIELRRETMDKWLEIDKLLDE